MIIYQNHILGRSGDFITDSIIGAGSVVTKSIPADCIAAGNPCKVIRELK